MSTGTPVIGYKKIVAYKVHKEDDGTEILGNLWMLSLHQDWSVLKEDVGFVVYEHDQWAGNVEFNSWIVLNEGIQFYSPARFEREIDRETK